MMQDEQKSKEQLLQELRAMRRDLEAERTGRRKAEEALRHSERRLHHYFVNSPYGIILCEMLLDNEGQAIDFVHLDANPATATHTGWNLSAIINRRASELVSPAELAQLLEIYGQVVFAGQPTSYTQYFPLYARTLQVTVFHLEECFFIINFIDITEHERAQEELNAYISFLDNIMEQSPFAIWIADQGGTVLRTNNTLRKTLKLTDDQIVGNYNVFQDGNLIEQGVMPQVRAVFEEHRPARFIISWAGARTGNADFAGAVQNLDIDVSMFPIVNPSGELEHVICQWLNITERKLAEQEIRRKEELLHMTGEIAQVGGWEFDADNLQGSWTDEVARIHGLDPAQATNVELGLSFYTGASREKIEAAIRDALDRGQAYDLELELISVQGEKKWVRTIGRPVKDGEKVVKVQGIFQDISERKQAEEELRQYREHLEELVSQRTEELHAKNQELETFAYSVSHDLKAPLRGIDGYSRLLLEDYLDRLDEDGRLFLHNIRHAARQMSQLIEDLLAYSRLERQTLKTGQANLLRLLKELLAERANDINERGVRLTIDLPCEVVTADASGLTQIWRNLLDNALKFTQTVAVPRIEIGGEETADRQRFWVRDNGIGFDMQYQKRIFEIFQRLHRAEDFPGTGIGLAIVRKALERMGGRVWAESRPGAGATFYLEFRRIT